MRASSLFSFAAPSVVFAADTVSIATMEIVQHGGEHDHKQEEHPGQDGCLDHR